MTRMLKEKKPRPIGFCWLMGKDLSQRMINDKQCMDPEKQKATSGICKHLQLYGSDYKRRYKYLTIAEYCQRAHENAKNKGFWDNPREFGTMIALIHSELSEALEADRHQDNEGRAEELADVAIRLFDLCGGLEIDLEGAIITKMKRNESRTYLHGKKY